MSVHHLLFSIVITFTSPNFRSTDSLILSPHVWLKHIALSLFPRPSPLSAIPTATQPSHRCQFHETGRINLMAEQHLYANEQEPVFPYRLVLPHLSWLPEFLASNVTTSAEPSKLLPPSIAPIIDTLLVFTRARTSALHGFHHYRLCQTLVVRLNVVLRLVGATSHRIELVKRGPAQFFITSTKSPRFCWDTRLTHRIIGQNLDYFAPGHITDGSQPVRGSILFIEKQSLKAITAELVILSVLEDPVVRTEMEWFNDTRQSLYNRSMEGLGLSYRFKWVFNSAEARENVIATMKAPTPPPSAWWEANCYFVNGYGFPGLVQEPSPFCSFASHHQLWWPMIQRAFTFSMEYRRIEIWPRMDIVYWKEMSEVFQEIRTATESLVDLERISSLVDEFTGRLEELANAVDRTPLFEQPCHLPAPPYPSRWTIKHRAYGRWLSWRMRWVWENVKLHVFERSKLRKPLVRQGIVTPPGAIGDVFLFS